MRAREVAAYEARLSKITEADQLTAECLGAVVNADGYDGGVRLTVVGALLSFTHRLGAGLVGTTVWTDLVVIPVCSSRPVTLSCASLNRPPKREA